MAALQPLATNMIVVNTIWNIYTANVNVGIETYFTMPIALKTVIGEEGIRILENRYRFVQTLFPFTKSFVNLYHQAI